VTDNQVGAVCSAVVFIVFMVLVYLGGRWMIIDGKEATKALLDICQGKSDIGEVRKEYIQVAAMRVRQIIAINRLRGYW